MKGFFNEYGKVIVTAVIAISLISVTLALKPVVQNNLGNMVNDMSDGLSNSIVIGDVNVGGEDTGSGGSGSGGGSEPPVTPDPTPVTQTITAGTYTFKSDLAAPTSDMTENVNLTFEDGESNTATISTIQLNSNSMIFQTPIENGLNFYIAYNFPAARWSTENPKINQITITSDATVSQEFYDWFNDNITNMISFIFKEMTRPIGTYQAEEGMTFENWVNSSYNTDGYKLDLNNMHPDGSYNVLNSTETLVSDGGFSSTTTIVNNKFYTLGPNANAPVNIISFTIEGIEYQAVEGMTWEQWINSEYNDSNFVIYNNGPYHAPTGNQVYFEATIKETKDTIIINNRAYGLGTHSGGSGN